VSAVALEEAGRAPSALRGVLASTQGKVGLTLAALMLATIAFGRFVTPHSPTETGASPNVGPSGDHWLGTDHLGRDVLSRILAGGDQIILIPLLAVTLAYLVGGGAALFAAYWRGRFDSVVARLFDVLLAFPGLLLALVMVAAVGPSTAVLVAVISIADIPRVGRVVRGAAQAVVTNDYVAAAQARGERAPSIVAREVVPNIVAPVLADYALRVTYGIITLATLSFLGLGAQPPAPDWGLMVQEARNYITIQPLAIIAPTVAIGLLSVSFNLIADAVTRHVARDGV
jgi:peptide/nickel transport system permease protein